MTTAIILAGGLGTRLRIAVPNLPKPMAPILGKPFLEHQIKFWMAQGVTNFILSVGYQYEKIVDYFGSQFNGANIEYVIEKKPLGTGGALLLAAQKIKEKNKPFLLLNGDTYFNVDLRALKLFAEKKESDWTFSLFSSHDKSRYMKVNADRDGLLHFSAGYRGISCDLVNGGVYWIQPRVFERLSIKVGEVASLEADLLPEIEKEGYRIYGYEFKSTFIDIGLPDDYENAKKIIPSS